MRGKAGPAKIPGLLLAVFAMLALGPPGHCAQSPEADGHRVLQLPNDDTPREIIYPYYSLREGFDSKLEMMDRAPRPVEFRMAIHGISGQTIWAKPMTIQPNEPLDLDIREVLTDLSADTHGDFSEGSLSLHFKGKGNPLGGRMLVEGKYVSWNLGPVWKEGEFGQSMIPQRLDTFWWDLGGTRDVEIRVDNTSSEAVVADLYLDFKGKRHPSAPLHFAPYEMKHLDISQLLAQMGLTAYEAPLGGMSIVSRTAQPVLVAEGNITDSETKRITGLDFPLSQMQFASALHATGVPISTPRADSPFAGMGNFTPHVFVRNLLDSEQTVTITVEYPGVTGPDKAVLEPIRVGAFSTEDIRLDSYYYKLPLPLPYCALRIQYNGPHGSLIGKVTTVEENTGKVSDMVVRNEWDGYAGGLASYWSIGDNKEIYVFFTNMGDKVCRIGMRVDAGGVQYFVPHLMVDPHETTYISMRDLRDKQEPDVRGHTIPKDVTEGRLFYNRLDDVPLEGRIMELPRRKMH